MTKEQGEKVTLWVILGGTATVIVLITWVFGAGALSGDVKKIPDIERRVKTLEITSGETVSELRYIRKGIDRIERKIDK